jgi:hypothetical protein
MTATPELAARYLAVWRRTPLPPTEEGPRPPHPSQAQSGTRDGACGGTLQRGLRYTDPLADVTGHDAIEATIAAVQAQFPGSVFRLAGPVDVHHDQVRFTWHLGPEGRRRRSWVRRRGDRRQRPDPHRPGLPRPGARHVLSRLSPMSVGTAAAPTGPGLRCRARCSAAVA